VSAQPFTTLEWTGQGVRLLDQTLLPFEETYVECETLENLGDAIERLVVRGAPALGVAAGYGMALAAQLSTASNAKALRRDLRIAGRQLVTVRPTAVNIAWAVERIERRVAHLEEADAIRATVVEEARSIEAEDRKACDAMGRHGAPLIPQKARILTHCNTGHLCSAGIGTAQGVIETAHVDGKGVHVWVDETRPLLQGSRLTAWELQRLGVPMTLVTDSSAASLMSRGEVDLVITGADRIAANGDTANKVGTYGLAVLAKHFDIPFYVTAPRSTVDSSIPSGESITIEHRDPSEVTAPRGIPIAPPGTPAGNPAFDVTPGSLVAAIVTEDGILRPPYRHGLVKKGGKS
jgi:methylthioribose-1-phosphate isomerase